MSSLFHPSRRGAVIEALIAVAASALLYYWWTQRSPAVQYRTAAVTRGPVVHAVIASGTVNPMTTIQVGTYVSGVIQQINCDFNTRVKAGQLCAKIDPRPYQTIVDQEAAALATARAQQTKDAANLAFSKLIYQRDLDLLRRQIVSQETIDTALNAYQQSQAQVELDKSSVEQHLASLHAAQVSLDYTNIISPVDGTVVSRNVTQGQTVAASFQTPTLFLIATDLTQMQVDTNISESDIGNVRVGEKAQFTVEAYPDRSFAGSVIQVRQAPQSVQNVITYDAVVATPNPQLLLMPGMTAAVRVIADQRADVVRVLDQALRYLPGGSPSAAKATPPAPGPAATGAPGSHSPRSGAVWRLVHGKPIRVPLELGLDDDTFSEVLQGALQVGEPIIVGESVASAGASTPRLPRL